MKSLKKEKIKNIYFKLLGSFIKKGKKTKSKRILNKSLFILSKIFKLPAFLLLNKLFLLLSVFVETKTINLRRSRYIVPFPVTSRRRVYLVVKWLTSVVFKDRRRVPLSRKLSLEIFVTLRGLKSKTLNLKLLNNIRAIGNRSNFHYRW